MTPGTLMQVASSPLFGGALTCDDPNLSWWAFRVTLVDGAFVLALEERRMEDGGYVIKAITSRGVTWVDRAALEECQ